MGIDEITVKRHISRAHLAAMKHVVVAVVTGARLVAFVRQACKMPALLA
jgi:hypothetical protein